MAMGVSKRRMAHRPYSGDALLDSISVDDDNFDDDVDDCVRCVVRDGPELLFCSWEHKNSSTINNGELE